MNEPAKKFDPTYDREDDQQSLSARERADERWGMKPEDLSAVEKNGGEPVKHEDSVGRGYNQKPHYELPTSFFAKFKKRRGLTFAIGGGAAVSIIGILAFFSLIGNFKLDFLISNIDQRVFLRFTSVADRRSSKWVQSYLTVRMLEWGEGRGPGQVDNSQYFRSNKVDTNSPFTDWYRTMRTSKFEQELFEKRGIKFSSVADANGKPRLGYININGERRIDVPISDEDFRKIGEGNVETLNKFSRFFDPESDTFANDKEARRAIKRVVNDNTRFFQILERRMYRKAIQNMTGVRSWRFFEDTRNKVDEKKINIRNKIILAAIPKTTMSGKFLRCLFGMATCQKSVDPANSQYRATVTDLAISDPCDEACEDRDTKKGVDYDEKNSSLEDPKVERREVEKPDPNCPKGQTCPPIKVIGDAPDLDLTPREAQILDFMRFAISGVFKGIALVNIIETLNLLQAIDDALSGGLEKTVAVARGTQAMGLYQVMKTSRDQHKSGNVNSAEYNQFNQVIGSVASSEGWTKVITDNGDSSKLTNTKESQEYCSKKNQDFISNPQNTKAASEQFHYLCSFKQIGGGSTAASITEAYNSSFGVILDKITDAWKGLKDITDKTIVGKIFAFGYKLLESAFNATANALIDIIRFTIGRESLKQVEVAMTALVQKIATFLGAGPILSDNDPAGVFFNWMVQGGAYSAENVARFAGAMATSPASQASTQRVAQDYRTNQLNEYSVFERYLSTSNPDSVGSQTMMALNENDVAGITAKFFGIGNLFKNFASAIIKPFQSPANAAVYTGYEGANFAGIQTFDYPQECIDLDPLQAGPIDGTNIFEVLDDYDIPASPSDWGPTTKEQWEVANDSEDFYDYLYGKLSGNLNPDEITLQIYNCNLLDTSVRGGLGYIYGYTKDNGLDENSGTTAQQPPAETNPIPPGGTVSGSIQELAKQILANSNISYPLDASSPNGDTKAVLQALANGQKAPVDCLGGVRGNTATTDINIGILKYLVELGNKTKVGVNALTDKCHSPNSNHYKGLAVDFECGAVPFNISLADPIAAKYGGKRNGETCANHAHWHYDFL